MITLHLFIVIQNVNIPFINISLNLVIFTLNCKVNLKT